MNKPSENAFFPILVNLQQLSLLIVGGGTVALEKVRFILDNYPDSDIKIISPEVHEDILSMLPRHASLRIETKNYESQDLSGVNCVVNTCQDKTLSVQLESDARKQGIWLHTFNQQESSSFQFMPVFPERPKFSISKRRIWIYSFSIPAMIILGYLISIYFPPTILGEYVHAFSQQIDSSFFYFVIAGFIAQMIDGALGMAYGVTATTFLLSFGISPAASSASVHASEVFTSGVSGLMHLKFGNVNSKLFKRLLIPGVIGAILGAYVLTSLEQYNYIIKPVISVYTLILGIVILVKAIQKTVIKKKIKRIFPLALAGGFLDSIGGGGWGPVVSSTLIVRGRNPRFTIGSVNLAEFFVALASSVTFVTVIGLTHWAIIAGLICGGVIAAPIAAYMANKIPTKTIMILVGTVVIILSLKRIFF